ncbi:MAG TPA: pyruvate ferredoxin oxidoreductase subunit gamma [archaeon]|nr:pyruvate ferredoxin oxidoreductase subunit gamma [archaeon]
MIEIRIHGRGGQGAVTAAEMLAVAAFKDGKFSQAFPFFGTERTGAPVAAFCRIDDKFIRIREHVYNPNYVLVLDPTLLTDVDVLEGLKSNGMVIINTSRKIKLKTKAKVKEMDVAKIALEVIGKPFVNIATLGVFAAATKSISMKSLVEAVNERFPKDVAELNVKCLQKVYDGMKK